MTPRAALAVLAATIVVGTLDALDAIVFFGFRGATPVRIFQSIASGVLGRAAFEGDRSTMWIGVGLHYLIAFLIVLVFYIISTRVRLLTKRPVAVGLLYGILVYVTMNYVVVPLSAAVQGPFSLPVFVNGILIHIFGVGLPTALIVRMGNSQ
jgi:uncharacterized membrane protein YagU involved in acid resistance